MFDNSPFYHAGVGFAAVAIIIRVVGAVIDGIQKSVFVFEHFLHMVVDVAQTSFIQVTAGDTGLVGHQYGLEPVGIQHAQPGRNARQEHHVRHRMAIGHVADEGTVTVQKNCPVFHRPLLWLDGRQDVLRPEGFGDDAGYP